MKEGSENEGNDSWMPLEIHVIHKRIGKQEWKI